MYPVKAFHSLSLQGLIGFHPSAYRAQKIKKNLLILCAVPFSGAIHMKSNVGWGYKKLRVVDRTENSV
jgi:hypothetical protein